MVDRKLQWRRAILDSEAARLLRDGQGLPVDAVLLIQSHTDTLLQTSSISKFSRARITPGTEVCDTFLHPQIRAFRGPERTAAIIACLHTLTGSRSRREVFNAMPATDMPGQDFEISLLAHLECIIQGREIQTGIFKKSEATTAKKLRGVVVLGRDGSSDLFPAMWEFMYELSRLTESIVVNNNYNNGINRPDDHRDLRQNLFPDHLVSMVLTPERGRILKETLNDLSGKKEWPEAYHMVYGLRNIYQLPGPKRILKTIFSDYHMWSVWTPNNGRIREWSESKNEELQRHRGKLAPFFMLEGPDISRAGKQTLRMSTPTNYFDTLLQPGEGRGEDKLTMLEDLLESLDVAIKTGPFSVDLLVQMCLAGSHHPIDHKVIQRLKETLRLNHDEHCNTLARYLIVVRDGGQDMTVYDCVVAVANAIPIIGTSVPLQVRWGADFDISKVAQNIFRRAQRILCWERLPKGQPCEPFARAVWDLARALANSTWLHGQWTESFLGVLYDIPEFWRIQEALKAMASSTVTDEEHAHRMEFIIDTLGREESTLDRSGSAPGPRPLLLVPLGHRTLSASFTSPGQRSSASLRRPASLQRPRPPQSNKHVFNGHYDDLIWHKPLLITQQDQFRKRIKEVPDISGDLATRCMHQAVNERHPHLAEISQHLFNITDHSCILLSIFMGDLIKGAMLMDSCWADLLLHVMRVRHRQDQGLLDHLADDPTLTIEHFGRWIESLHQVLGTRFMNPAGRMDFTVAKIQQCGNRIRARRRVNVVDLERLRASSPERRISTEVDHVFTPNKDGSMRTSTPGTSIRSRDGYTICPSVADGRPSGSEGIVASQGYFPPCSPASSAAGFDGEKYVEGRSLFSREGFEKLENTSKDADLFSETAAASTDSSSSRSWSPPLPM